MISFLADESVDFGLVEKLRSDGYQVDAIIEISPGIVDDDVLELANEMSAILITEDKDFGELTYRLQRPNHGIILLRMSGESMEERVKTLYLLFENHKNKLGNSFSVITVKKIRVIPLSKS